MNKRDTSIFKIVKSSLQYAFIMNLLWAVFPPSDNFKEYCGGYFNMLAFFSIAYALCLCTANIWYMHKSNKVQ